MDGPPLAGAASGAPHRGDRIDGSRAASSVVEHLTFNQGVPGSIPGRPTNKITSKARPARRAFSIGATVVQCRNYLREPIRSVNHCQSDVSQAFISD